MPTEYVAEQNKLKR